MYQTRLVFLVDRIKVPIGDIVQPVKTRLESVDRLVKFRQREIIQVSGDALLRLVVIRLDAEILMVFLPDGERRRRPGRTLVVIRLRKDRHERITEALELSL